MSLVRMLVLPFLLVLLPGCASYYSHFGSFEATNSEGEARKFVVYWQTADYPDWFWADDTSTPIMLQTQCSDRKLYFADEFVEPKLPCIANGSGTVACGDPELDLTKNGRPVTSNREVCGFIEGANGQKRITKMGSVLRVNIRCLPTSVEYEVDGKKKNRDYLKLSVAPYTIGTKKVSKDSLGDRVPTMSDKICKKK